MFKYWPSLAVMAYLRRTVWGMNLPFIYLCPPDHPIDPPTMDGNPFYLEMSDDLGYIFRPENGVIHVYNNQESLQCNEPNDYQYPDLNTFHTDKNILLSYMADGPL